jgi:tight adherence protein B
MAEDPKDARRKQLQESLNQLEQRERQRRQKMTLRVMLSQAGLEVTPRIFYVFSIVLGLIIGLVVTIAGVPWYVAIVAAIAGFFGVPRWLLKFLRKRRQQVFLNDFADAIDIMVRGLKSGLPVTDAMKVISTETPAPVGPEFLEIVEGQRVGISIEQGIERMYDRMPLPEVNFLSIVMNIQSKTGGNLSEALNNLSKVLRDRKKMKAKITAMSQEAKASAAIIGSLPFVIMGALTVLNPAYLNPLWDTTLGNIMVIGSGVWMVLGILVMRKMINFDF